MAYFIDHYRDFRWPLADGPQGQVGFRHPQAGGLHAIAAHFSRSAGPAIVTMPTGSGKTAVLASSPFVLRCRKALVLTPSRLVREQLVEAFARLTDLRALGALEPTVPAPTVVGVRKRIASWRHWDEIEDSDVVVAIPSSIATEPIFVPRDAFDLVLVDEAHHSPAATWHSVLRHCESAKTILFTATPFRRDRREVQGTFVYTYELREAVADGVFGQIEYQPVDPATGEDPDLAIAHAAAAALEADRAAGFSHRMMVRSGTRSRAEELLALYRRETRLRLELVLGNHALSRVRRVLRQLDRDEIDGIVCVDMFGEGFNLPSLKVAALHTPHRSLPVILQFIGRFARTTGTALGPAKFFALASDMRIERERLYELGATWDELIPNLAASRIREERETREALATFGPLEEGEDRDFEDISLFALKPYHHVKIFEAVEDVDVQRQIEFPAGFEPVLSRFSPDFSVAVYVTRQRSRPEWSTVAEFDSISFEMFVVYHHKRAGLVFLCASARGTGLYQHFAEALGPGNGRPLESVSQAALNRVLLDLTEIRFFNVGMKNTHAMMRRESYRTVVGQSVDQALARSDARVFRRGHWFCSAREGGVDVTIGLSSAAKVWSHTATQIPQLVSWCDRLAAKIRDNRVPVTQSGMDYLPIGAEVGEIPDGVAFADWHPLVYRRPVSAWWRQDGKRSERLIIDFDLNVVRSSREEIVFSIQDGVRAYQAVFSYQNRRLVQGAGDADAALQVEEDGELVGIEAFLNENAPTFFTRDFGMLDGRTFTPPEALDEPLFSRERVEIRDWAGAGVDIEVEIGRGGDGLASVQEWLERELAAGDSDVVFYDHGPGEIADFVAVRVLAGGDTRAQLYHCKASVDDTAGARLEDVEELAAQIAKSVAWGDARVLLRQIRHRSASRQGRSRWIKGDAETLERVLGGPPYKRLAMEVIGVNPGVSRDRLSASVAAVLAAADDFVVRCGYERLRILGSR